MFSVTAKKANLLHDAARHVPRHFRGGINAVIHEHNISNRWLRRNRGVLYEIGPARSVTNSQRVEHDEPIPPRCIHLFPSNRVRTTECAGCSDRSPGYFQRFTLHWTYGLFVRTACERLTIVDLMQNSRWIAEFIFNYFWNCRACCWHDNEKNYTCLDSKFIAVQKLWSKQK